REHQYLALLGSSRAKGDKKEEAAEQARRIASAWMWLSYQLMARCYGALMMTVLMDFCLNSQLALTIEEQWLFRQMHLPQLYLAGLPVDFLGKAQLRCIFLALRERWLNLIYEPTAYDSLTDMLGWFGLLIRDRRRADRRRKAEEAGHRPIRSSADILENH